MPIAQIKQYAMLLNEGDHTAIERLYLLKSHLSFIQKQLQQLQSTEQLILKKVDLYEKYLRKNDSLKDM